MTNTADDILLNIETQEYFVLVAGRWYSSRSLDKGPWSFVEPDQVPVFLRRSLQIRTWAQ